jgi:ABC-type polysaccharide/polyol phosphate export permease
MAENFPPVYTPLPDKPVLMNNNLYKHRSYLAGSFWTDFRTRYAGTALGFFWFFINPLLDAVIYTLVFSQILAFRSDGLRGVDYTIFILTGVFPWVTLSQIISRGSNALNAQAPLLRRLAIPSEVFVARDSLMHLTGLLIYMAILLVFVFFLGYPISFRYFLVIPLALIFCLFGFGIALMIAPLRVLFPDVGEILGALIQIWRWTLPVSFPFEIFPDRLQTLLVYNPPFYFIQSFRDVILENSLPTTEAWIHMLAWMLISIVTGFHISGRFEPMIREYL